MLRELLPQGVLCPDPMSRCSSPDRYYNHHDTGVTGLGDTRFVRARPLATSHYSPVAIFQRGL